jgi:hypothetical protein
MSGLRKMHAKVSYKCPFEKVILNMLYIFVLLTKPIYKISKFTSFCLAYNLPSQQLLYFSLKLTKIVLASLKCTPKVYFLAKLSDSNWRMCIFSFHTFLHFHIFNLSLKVVLQKYSNLPSFYTMCKVCEA